MIFSDECSNVQNLFEIIRAQIQFTKKDRKKIRNTEI